MKLNNLRPASGSTKTKKRLGRGEGSGKGGTASRGHNGAQSRSGYSRKSGFEGGQMPLQRRVPKFGFKNINRKEYQGVNLSNIQTLVDNKEITEITIQTLIENGLVSKNDLVKILGNGTLTAKINISAHGFSATAKTAIEANGGTATIA